MQTLELDGKKYVKGEKTGEADGCCGRVMFNSLGKLIVEISDLPLHVGDGWSYAIPVPQPPAGYEIVDFREPHGGDEPWISVIPSQGVIYGPVNPVISETLGRSRFILRPLEPNAAKDAKQEMRLEVGKTYRTRGGWEAEVLRCERQDFLVRHVMVEAPWIRYHQNQGGLWHYEDGTVVAGDKGENHDLISEIPTDKPAEAWPCPDCDKLHYARYCRRKPAEAAREKSAEKVETDTATPSGAPSPKAGISIISPAQPDYIPDAKQDPFGFYHWMWGFPHPQAPSSHEVIPLPELCACCNGRGSVLPNNDTIRIHCPECQEK